MWKLLAVLIVLALLLSVIWMGHALATGIVVPYPDPTPEQAAFERYHLRISGPLFVVAALGWLVAGATTAWCVVRWLIRINGRGSNQIANNPARSSELENGPS